MAQRRRVTARRQFADFAASRFSPNDLNSPIAYCPLVLSTVQLIPVRYGLVETIDPSAASLDLPYRLSAHPLGFRMLRDGFFYLIDGTCDALHEYRIKDSLLAPLDEEEPGPVHLLLRRGTHVHVAYAEVQWTLGKCTQMTSQPDEREHFMQRVELPEAGAQNSRHLFYREEMKQWLGEATLSRDWSQVDNLIAESADMAAADQRPWDWEHAPLFYHTLVEELSSKAEPGHYNDYLFVAVEDDIGVMRDLAHYQDQVVGKLDAWRLGGATEGQVERDYVLGCYIESLTQIGGADFANLAAQNPSFQAMLDELEQMPEPQRTQTRDSLQAVLGEDPSEQTVPSPTDPDLPADLKQQLDRIRGTTYPYPSPAQSSGLSAAVRLYCLKQKFVGTDPAFLDRHEDALWRAYSEQNRVMEQRLYGAKFGSRGINDLIDRPAMDAFLAEQRAQLSALNDQLDRITADRVQLFTENRFHRAAWYYDITDAEQVEQALVTEYACLKDIGRSDEGNEKIRAWLEDNLIFTRSMLYALPRSVQTELAAQLTLISNAGWALISNSSAWLEKFALWGKGVVLDVARLPEAQQITVHAVWKALEPAIQQGIADATHSFMKELGQDRLPDMDELFRRMPKAAGLWILDAARREQVTFRVAGVDDIRALADNVRKVQMLRQELRKTNNAMERRKSYSAEWHASGGADKERAYRRQLQGELNRYEAHLATAMSPLAELPPHALPLQTATSLKPGLSLVFPSQQQAQVRSLLENYRTGVRSVPAKGLLGDGAGFLVFLAQLVNLVQVLREVRSGSQKDSNWLPIVSSSTATAAAGFGAAQGIFDTALKAHADALKKSLLNTELRGVHVQMGKLHIGLGLPGYLAGFIAAGFNLNNSLNNWSDAVRRGNHQAQAGAAVAAAGSAGFMGSNAYGLIETSRALGKVAAAAKLGQAESLVAWASAGVRLSTVFMRVNIAGILFTALELAGTWLYNRYNLSQHDRWLLTTPWSREPDGHTPKSLEEYQTKLRWITEAPRFEILPPIRNQYGLIAERHFLLHFPTLTAKHFAQPLASDSSDFMLRLGGYRIQRKIPRYQEELWWPLSPDELQSRIQIYSENPLILRLTELHELAGRLGAEHYDLMLVVETLHAQPDGKYSVSGHNLRFRLSGQTGEVLNTLEKPKGRECELFVIRPLHLPEVQKKNG